MSSPVPSMNRIRSGRSHRRAYSLASTTDSQPVICSASIARARSVEPASSGVTSRTEFAISPPWRTSHPQIPDSTVRQSLAVA